jgi:hypothetical protein
VLDTADPLTGRLGDPAGSCSGEGPLQACSLFFRCSFRRLTAQSYDCLHSHVSGPARRRDRDQSEGGHA